MALEDVVSRIRTAQRRGRSRFGSSLREDWPLGRADAPGEERGCAAGGFRFMNRLFPLVLEHRLPTVARYAISASIMLGCAVLQMALQMQTGSPCFRAYFSRAWSSIAPPEYSQPSSRSPSVLRQLCGQQRNGLLGDQRSLHEWSWRTRRRLCCCRRWPTHKEQPGGPRGNDQDGGEARRSRSRGCAGHCARAALSIELDPRAIESPRSETGHDPRSGGLISVLASLRPME